MSMLKKMKSLLPASAFLMPTLAFAVGNGIADAINTINNAFQAVIPIIIALIIIYFFYGLAKYILAAGNAESADEGKSIMIYGVIAMFVAFSIWGIIRLLQTSLGADQNSAINVEIPQVINPNVH